MRHLTISLVLMTMVCISLHCHGQDFLGSDSWHGNDLHSAHPNISTYQCPEVDLAKLKEEDEIIDAHSSTGYRFGAEQKVDINFFDLARTVDQGHTWQLIITCPSALGVSLQCSALSMSSGDEIKVSSLADTRDVQILQASAHNDHWATRQFKGEGILIEFHKHAVSSSPSLVISNVIHGYRPLINKWEKTEFGQSSACHVDVNCHDSQRWSNEKRSVALIVSGGSAICSGALINNTENDGQPLFLTANHCLGNFNSWVFYFGHESEECVDLAEADQFQISGCHSIAEDTQADLRLLELHQPIPRNKNVYFSGWKVGTHYAKSAIGIHHPLGDFKKICFEDDSIHRVKFGEEDLADEGEFWHVPAFDRQTMVEIVSSGSPLFENGKIIGVMSHSSSPNVCGNEAFYGALDHAWPEFEKFLNPNNSDQLETNGFEQSAVQLELVSKPHINQSIHVWPNPSRDLCSIAMRLERETTVNLSILNLNGSEVMSESRLASAGDSILSLNTSALVQGMYVLKVQRDDGYYSSKLLTIE
jgi:hypothetical protein